jgi:RHS repeat-associated protein
VGAAQFHIGGSSTVANGQEIDIWGPQLGPTPPSSSVTNYVPYSQQIGGASWNQYCAANSSNMTLNTTDVTAPDGSKTATSYVTPNTSTCGSAGSWGAFANVAGGLSVGQTYTASIWLKGASGGEGVVLGLNDCANTNVTLTTSWRRYTYTASTIPSSVASCELGTGIRGFQFLSTNSTIYAWGAQLETASIAGPYVATLDSPITAPIDSTNFLESSDQINGNGWEATTGMTVAQTTAISAPDSSNTAYAVSGTSTNSELTAHIANPGLYDGAQVTASVYLSVPAGSTLSNINISLINGTAAGSTTVVTQSVSLSSNWQRFSITGTNLNGLTGLVFLIGGSNTLPANQTIYVWGGQMVMGASPGALIPTQNTTTNNSNGASTTLSPNGLNMAFSYDAFGNMISSGNFNFQQSYTTANQLSGWAYDPSGNLVNDGLGNTYAYDAEGKITGVGGYTYVYDADGNRVSKSGSTAIDHFYFGGREVATLSGGQWTDLIYGTSGLLAEVPGTQYGAPTYRMMDQLGTQVGTLDPSGVLLSLTDYAPFGQVFNGGSNDPYKFTGKERDTESGNDYFGARYYESGVGRFMSPDWSTKEEPVPYAKLYDPQTLNLYAYVGNNPLSAVDVDGHISLLAGIGTSSCAGEGSVGCSPAEIEQQQAPQQAIKAQQQSSSTGGLTPAQLQNIKNAAMQLAAKDAKTFAKGIPGFSLKAFDSELQNATYVQDPHGTNGSVEANTVSTGRMSGRSTHLYADFFSDTPERQAGVLVHENIHRYTGWTDSNVFYQFQHLGMTSGEVKNFTSFGNTDGITTWILRMAK